MDSSKDPEAPRPQSGQGTPPRHPGVVLKKEYQEPFGLSVTELAAKLGVSRNTLSSIINERAGVSSDMALRLAMAFRTTPEQWLKLMYTYDLYQAEQIDSGWREVEPLRRQRTTLARNGRRGQRRKRVPRV